MNRKLQASRIGGALVAALLCTVASALPAHAATPPDASVSTRRDATTTFHFANIPVRSALQLIAEEGDFNLVVSDSVQGNITLRLVDVTWREALEVVLRLKGLQQRVDSVSNSVTVSGG